MGFLDRVLVVEDDKEISEVLRFYLTQDGSYDVLEARSAEGALALLGEGVDAILLDIRLPGMDGIAFCRQVRSRLFCPIIFISCLDDDETIVRAMNMGGDDYLVKPFSCQVLKAHLDANLRRARMLHPAAGPLAWGGLSLDPATRKVSKDGREVVLSPTEYEILYYMMRRPGEFLEFEEVYQGVWGGPSCGDLRTLFTHVANLRKKIEDDPKSPRYIVTRQRDGYVFGAAPSSSGLG